MADTIPSDVKQFRVSFISIFLFLVTGIPIGVVIGFFLFGYSNLHKFLFIIEIGIPFFLLFAIIEASVLYFFTKPMGFSSDGIYASSRWGFRRFIRWSDIAKVKKYRLFNLKFLKIYSNIDGKVTTLRLFQSQKKEFREEICKFAPPSSPVLDFLNWL